MAARRVALAIDIGTTATKALAIDAYGEVLAEASCGYPLSIPEPGAAELDPDEVRSAALEALARCRRDAHASPVSLSFSSAMHSLIAVDDAWRPLSGCFTFADERPAAQARALHERGIAARLHARTGTPVQAMSPLCKLLWLAEQRPRIFASAARFVSLKEYVLAALVEEPVADSSMASGTGLYSLAGGDWDTEALAVAQIDAARLCPVAAVDEPLTLRADAADELGLPRDVLVVPGGGDGPLANLGSGVREPGLLALTVGTSGAVRATATEARVDGDGILFCYVIDAERFAIGGPINNGGVVIRWLRGILGEDDPLGLEEVDALAAAAEPGAQGLLLLPFLTGERAPLWDPAARGVLFGLSLEHRREDVARAAMEGVAFALATVADPVEELVGRAEAVRAGGGFVNSRLWVQIVADVLGRPVQVPAHADPSAIGAAVIALAAAGALDPADVDDRWLGGVTTYEPDRRNAEVYAHLRGLYREVTSALAGCFADAARLSRTRAAEAAGPADLG